MQAPSGVSGVQARPNSLQSLGLFTPRRIAGHSQLLVSRLCFSLIAKRVSASNSAKAGAIARALSGTEPSPRHSKLSRSTKTSSIIACARALPSSVTTRAYWFSTSARPSLT